MLLTHFLLVVFWVLYGAVHSVLASGRAKALVQNRAPKIYPHYRLLYNLLAFAALAAVVWFQLSIDTIVLFNRTPFSDVAGVVVAGSGLLLMGLCIKKYFLSLSGLQSLWKEEKRSSLMIAGIHRRVRHPLYLGTFLFLWGLLLRFPTLSLLLCCTVITGYTLVGIRWEEKKLVAEFGDAYRRYRQTVPMLIPKI